MRTLRNGAAGPFVFYLQLALSRAGYDTGNTDGIFGTRTLDALISFQKSNGLTPDGIVGKMTWARLFPFLAGYTIHGAKRGDTFFALAEQYHTTVVAIETANPAVQPKNIPVGAKLIIPLGFGLVPDNVPYSYALNTLLVDGLKARYPFIETGVAGKSVMGKELATVTIGTGEKQVFYDASHHANEWITSPLLLKYAEAYCQAYVSGGELYEIPAKSLFEKTTLTLLPLVNPDGVDLVTGALPPEDSYYQRAKAMSAFYPSIPFPSGWKADISGVDLNLSYPAGWEQAKKIKFAQGYTRPGPRDYVGTEPLSEPESRSVYNLTQKNDYLLTLSYHTQGQVIYYQYLNFDPPRSQEIALAFQKASGYQAEETPYASGFAGYKDWFIQTYNRPGYTIEAGSGTNPLPLSQLPAIYRENVGILTLGMALIL